MKKTKLTLTTIITSILALSAVTFGVTKMSTETTDQAHDNASLHCQHFPADCTDEAETKAMNDTAKHENSNHSSTEPLEPGQGMFGAISEINKIIEETGADWAKVDLDALWMHLQDMDTLMSHAKVDKVLLDDGIEMQISGEGAADRAVQVMIPAHSEFLKAVRPNWEIAISGKDANYQVIVTSSDPNEVIKIQALGFSGFMVQDDHHASHHLGIGLGNQVH